MNYDPELRPGASGIREAGDALRDGTLAHYAELVRRHLDCRAVVIRIEGRFLPLLDRDAPACRLLDDAFPTDGAALAPRLHAADRGALYAMALDHAAPLPAPASADPALLADPLAAGDLGYGFYAGLPLRLASGEPVGMLAALDFAPRRLSKNELATLRMLAALVLQVVEFRLSVGALGPRP